jgi:hypothetical protein
MKNNGYGVYVTIKKNINWPKLDIQGFQHVLQHQQYAVSF